MKPFKISKKYLEFNPNSAGSNAKGQKFYLMSIKPGKWQDKIDLENSDVRTWPTSIEVDGQTYKRKSIQGGHYLEDHGGFYRRETDKEVIDIWLPYATPKMIEEQKALELLKDKTHG